MDREQHITPPNPKDEVLRKIGRNLLIFQQIEGLLEISSKSFEMMREERNRLVHHFLPYWQPDSPENLLQASDYPGHSIESVSLDHN
ncbi:MAG: hypothetical protein IPH22_10890 [Nitrosomonas sp.]|nr:hypothetical protein [Nitrosomonas sp.]